MQMELFIIRHAESSHRTFDDTDKGRILTDRGRERAKEIGRYFLQMAEKPRVILCSPYTRTQQTAVLISEVSGISELVVLPWLAAGMSAEAALSGVQEFEEMASIILIGHQPDISYFIEALDSRVFPAQVEQGAVHHYTGLVREAGGAVTKVMPTKLV